MSLSTDTVPSTQAHSTPPQSDLFCPQPHPHRARNVNALFEAEQAAANLNQHVAVGMTKLFSSMTTFWLIALWIVLWIAANATIVHFDPLPWPLLLCLASVPQLPLMIVIMVGQGLLGRRQELQAEEQFNTTQKTYHDIEQIMTHLCTQDEELLRQTRLIVHLLKTSGLSDAQIAAIQAMQEMLNQHDSRPVMEQK
jgi:uncharacterized membrane protein